MEYVYVLQSLKDFNLYVGRSSNLKRRIQEHAHGKVDATRHRRPLQLTFYEAFQNKKDAVRREQYFKTTKGKSSLKQILRESLEQPIVAI